MPFYKVEVYDADGKRAELQEESSSGPELLKRLAAKGYTVTSITEGKPRQGLFRTVKPHGGTVNKKLSLEDQYLFCVTLSSYLKNGLTITEVLRLLQRYTKSKNTRPVYIELRESVESGRSLASSMRLLGVFRDSLVGMVESGERSASLPEILERASELIQNEIKLRRKLRSALTYPLLMLTVGLGVTVFLLTFVVPRLTALVIDSGAELPFATRLLVWLSKAVKVILPFTAAGILAAVYIIRRRGIKVSLPVFKDIRDNIAFAMIFSQIGTLLKSGISLVEALKLTEPLDPVKGRLAAVENYIKKGYRFSQGLEREGSFPEEIVSVVRVGESGRDLADGLIRLGGNCWNIAQASMQKYTTLAEPIIILCMGFIVGFVVIAVLLPIFDLSSLAAG